MACPNSLNSYLCAVGGSVEAVNQINLNKNKKVFFCAHRPPGHHAEKNKAMGFGVFNNIAISADYALRSKKFEKILIIDFDVHHGNGTQHIFENNPNIFYASSHQYPYYPGTGDLTEKDVEIYLIVLCLKTVILNYFESYFLKILLIKLIKILIYCIFLPVLMLMCLILWHQ